MLLAVAAFVSVAQGCGREPASAYSLDVACATLPPDDEALGRWLRAQDGTRTPTVTRAGGEVRVRFGSDRPPSPAAIRDVLRECDRLGYAGRTYYGGTLSDRSQRGTDWWTFWVEYTDLPADDDAVMAWLAGRPGVSQSTVRREGRVVVFEFVLASPQSPTALADITKKCQELGYGGQAGHITAHGRYK